VGVALVLFDMAGVLCRYEKDKRIAVLSRMSGMAPEAIDAAIWGSGFEDAGDAGAMDGAAYLRGFGAAIGYPLTLAEWTEAKAASLTPDTGVLDLARRVAATTRVAVLTNNSILVRDQISILFPELPAIFGDGIHVSAEFGARKPDVAAFLGCLAVLGVAPGDTLFIDDNAANVAGAERAGLQAHHLTGRHALEEELAKRSVEGLYDSSKISFPLEFVVRGTPVSLQAKSSKSKEAWKQRVKEA
jgi:HAD superfamily hydrolase (TIGR01509 family)